ncbi:prepilin-type N-terminal cleavage/methylation domain-containing protein [Oceanisphaera sp.]|uniref:prepilin-type N-terminal cleavage/methylation domain-containing protein n=1 Tax=Oceanisphaera sp. TaxID=1929979 RepID=UPI003A907C1E
MNKSAGFTLIELVIVIIILGILGAVAAPRLFNLQGDAYGANLNAMKSSISTAATMANAKAQIASKGMGAADADDAKSVPGYADTTFAFGYPIAGLNATTNVEDDWKGGILGTLDNFDAGRYNVVIDETSVTISPKSLDSEKCKVVYTQASKAADETIITPAEVTSTTEEC